MSRVIQCPRKLKPNLTVAFINDLWELFDEDIEIDFTTIEFAEPWSLLILAESLRRFVEIRQTSSDPFPVGSAATLEASISRGIGYLKHVGFFHYFGFPIGKKLGQAQASGKYTPIQRICRTDIAGDIFQVNIERLCQHLSEILYPENREAQDMMRYCLREIVRNTFEHANIDECAVMAQRWANNSVELAVLDSGRGIYESLKERYNLRDNRAALLHAIQPGVSGADLTRQSDVWGNSGYGLYIAAELGRTCGEFLLCSNGDTLEVTSGGEQYGRLYFYGTSIRLFLTTQDAEYFPNLLQQIVEKGEQLTKERTGRVRKASTKSMH